MDCDAKRVQVWENDLWRLETSIAATTPGHSYLHPKRCISQVTDLDGPEAATFGMVLAHVSRALKQETGAELVSVSIPPDNGPRLCVHLTPQADIAKAELPQVAERIHHRLIENPPAPAEQPPPLLPFPFPQAPPRRRFDEEPQPEIPPPHREPPDAPWPDRPAHDPWF
jgi:diadenosine tetraphosphate (Ap4A) HIT family hydrolase